MLTCIRVLCILDPLGANALCYGLGPLEMCLIARIVDSSITPPPQPDGEVQTTEDENTGRTYYVPELNEEKKPFRCILDVGIATTSTGNRVFGVLKVMRRVAVCV